MNRKHCLSMVVLILFVLILISCNRGNTENIIPEQDPTKHTEPKDLTDLTDKKPNPLDYIPVLPKIDPQPKEIDIHFVGDVMMDSYIGDYIANYGVDYPWTDVSPILQKADIAVANLETSVSTRGKTKKPAGYGFRSDPTTLEGLKNSGINMVSLANNHVLDFGVDALSDTLSSLKEYGIDYAGAGNNLHEAEQVRIVEKNGIKVGFISYTSIIPAQSWIAGEASPGIAPLKPEYYDNIIKHIKASDKECDLLIVLLHWGLEHSNQVEEWQRELAMKMIDNGADAIVGHHPHVLRGIEFYKDTPIIYSIGNFVFLKKDENAGHSAIFKMRFNTEGFVQGSIQPIHIQYCKANLLDAESDLSKQIMANMNDLSYTMGVEVNSEGAFHPITN